MTMRPTNLLLCTLILLGTHAAQAKADPACAACASYDQLAVKLRNNAPDALDDAIQKVGPLAAGRVKTLSAVEADALVKLMVPMLRADQADNGGDAAQQLANVWRRHATVMDAAVAKQTSDDQSYLRSERRRGARLLREGQD